ncbi:MAG: hypothetical protein R3281_14460 [Balneolaceae bacterium]|nr:hypothetical protein [Balneolaceae bacterium]
MKIWKNKFVLLAAGLALCTACGIGGSGGDEEKDFPAPFSVTINPQNAGSVSPEFRTYTTGDTVTVEASAFRGFAFDNWSGDQQSTENPFTFVIRDTTELVANFAASSSFYEVFLSVADTTDTLSTLRFGLKNSSTDGIDGDDLEAPPAPPQDELHAYFSNNVDLFWDYRSTTASSITWDLQLQPGTTDSLHFSWERQIDLLNGSLMLRSEDSSIEVDMTQQNGFSMGSNDADHLLIEYELGL